MMSTQPFDPARYKAGQRREWDTAARGYKYWGLVIGPQLQPVSERMMELADIQPGQRVLDVATGIGEPAVAHPETLINRLKLIKRQAYGRAGLSYLHHRFLAAA